MRETIYFKSAGNRVNIYSIPYWMKRDQHPEHLDQKFKDAWVKIGELDHNLKVVFLREEYQSWYWDFYGQFPPTFMEIDREFKI